MGLIKDLYQKFMESYYRRLESYEKGELRPSLLDYLVTPKNTILEERMQNFYP